MFGLHACVSVVALVLATAIALADACACDKNRPALMALNAATNGNDWTRKWNPADNVCAWEGVVCSTEGEVVALALVNNNLVGTLPDELGNLTHLEQFTVQRNGLYGTLPPALAAFNGSMRKFMIKENRFSGPIPAAYASWVNVQEIDCRINRLNGTLPRELAAWTQITAFEVGDNLIEGTLPPEYESWRLIRNFDVSFNNLTGTLPPSYSVLKYMRDFSISNNSLSGTLPPSYSNWTTLKFFELDFNHLTGTLPWEYRSWVELERLALHANALTGTLPADYGDTWLLVQSLSFPRNKLSGALPESWSKLNVLQLLSLSGNALNGTLPAAYGTLSSLVFLSLDGNHLSGTLPPQWGSLRLGALILQGNRGLVGTFPSEWSSMFSTTGTGFFSACDTQLCGTAAQVGLFAFQNITGLACLPPDAVGLDDLNEIAARAAYTSSIPCVDTQAPMPSTPAPPNGTRLVTDAATMALLNSAAQAAQGVLAWGALLVSALPMPMPAGAVAGLQAGIGALRLRRRCSEKDARTGALDATRAPPSPAVASEPSENPTLITIDALGIVLSYAGGAVLSNGMLILSFGCLLHAGSLLKGRIAQGVKLSGPSNSRFVRWLGQHLSSDRLPGALLTPFAILMQPSVTSSVVLMAHRGAASAGSTALGVFGIVLYCVPLLHTAWVFSSRLTPFPMEHRAIAAPPPRRPRRAAHPHSARTEACGQRQLLAWWTEPTEEWVSDETAAGTAAANVCATYEAVYRPYRGGWHAFLIVELALVALGGVVLGAGLSVEDDSACTAVLWGSASLAVLSSALLLLHAVGRPFVVRLDILTAVALDCLAVAAEVAALADDSGDVAESIVVAASCLELIVLVACAGLGIANGRASRGGQPPHTTQTLDVNPSDSTETHQQHRRRLAKLRRPRNIAAVASAEGARRAPTLLYPVPTTSQLQSLQSLIVLACTKDYLNKKTEEVHGGGRGGRSTSGGD